MGECCHKENAEWTDTGCCRVMAYNPKKLSGIGTVDPLSLALALENDVDERVEEAVEEMLDQVWRKIEGK